MKIQNDSSDTSDFQSEEKINKLLEVYVIKYVEKFEEKLAAYKTEANKSGATNPGTKMGKVKPAAEGAGAVASSLTVGSTRSGKSVGGGIANAATYFSARKHKHKAIAFSEFFRNTKSSQLRELLVKAGGRVFHSFESVLASTTDINKSPERGIEKFATDSVDRTVEYIHSTCSSSVVPAINYNLFTTGVVKGKSKDGFGSLLTPQRVQRKISSAPKPGRTVQFGNVDGKCKTSEIFDKVNVLVTCMEGSKLKYFADASRSLKNALFRREFEWEETDAKEIKQRLRRNQDLLEYKYDYKLDLNKLDGLLQPILKKIDENDAKLEQKRTNKVLNEIVEKLSPEKVTFTATTSWSNLDETVKVKIQQQNISFLGKKQRFSDLMQVFPETEVEHFLENLDPIILQKLLKETNVTVLTNNSIMPPDQPGHYIPRVFHVANQLNPNIFRINTNEKFVFFGLSQSEISDLAGNESIVTAARYRPNSHTRFIQLEHFTEYDLVCQNTKSDPVHLLKSKHGKLYWICSHGNTNTIRDFVLKQEITPLTETEILSEFQNDPWRKSVLIADCPGMGKSTLLGNLCRVSGLSHVSLYISMPKMFDDICMNESASVDDIIDTIAEFSSDNALGKYTIKAILMSSKIPKNIFMDGFDEVALEKQDYACAYVRKIKEFLNTKLYITTRLHKVQHLENALNNFAVNILPLDETQQSELVLSHWRKELESCDIERLENFSRKIVEICLSKMGDTSKIFAGVPLQCKMLAEMYKKDAVKYATVSEVQLDVRPYSLYELMKSLVNMKIERIPDEVKSEVLSWHKTTALQYLLPTQFANDPVELDEDFIEMINSVGIVVYQSSPLSVTFSHRVYAEFLLAQWLLESMCQPKSTKVLEIWKNVLLENVFAPTSLWGEQELYCPQDVSEHEVYKCMLMHPDVYSCRESWEQIMTALCVEKEGIQAVRNVWIRSKCNKSPYQYDDVLCSMMFTWTGHHNFRRPFSQLLNALSYCNFSKMAGKILTRIPCIFVESKSYRAALGREFFRKDFAFGTVAFLMDTGFSVDLSPEWNSSIDSPYKIAVDLISLNDVQGMIMSCVRHDYNGVLTYITTVLARHVDGFVEQAVQYDWFEIFAEACWYGSADIISTLFHFFETTLSLDSSDICEKLLTNQYIYRVAERGSFPVFDCMLKKLKPDESHLQLIIHICVQKTNLRSDAEILEKIQILEKLFKYSPALLHVMGPRQDTPLHSDDIHLKLLEYLVNAGVDPCVKANNQETLAHNAGRCYSPDEYHAFCEFMLSKGYHKAFTSEGFCEGDPLPLQVALRFKDVHPKTIRLLSKEKAVCFGDKDRKYLLTAIPNHRNVDVIKALVEEGEDAFLMHCRSRTFLHSAATSGNVEVIKYLLDLGLDVNSKDDLGQTPLHMTIARNNYNIHHSVKVLLENNADINALDSKGHTALWNAQNKVENALVQERTIELMQSYVTNTEDIIL